MGGGNKKRMKYNLISFSGLLATYFAWHYEFDDDYDNDNAYVST